MKNKKVTNTNKQTQIANERIKQKAVDIAQLVIIVPFTAFFWYEVYYCGGFDYIDIDLNYWQVLIICFIVGWLKL